MLLSEIVLKPRVRNDELDRWEYDVDWDKTAFTKLGYKEVSVTPTYEELEMFNKLGYNNTKPRFPVIYAWAYTKHAPTGTPEINNRNPNNVIRGSMDALKSRNVHHYMKPETLKDIYVKGFERIVNSKYGKSQKEWDSRKTKIDKLYNNPIPLTAEEQQDMSNDLAYRKLQSILKGGNKNNVVLVPLASSSTIPLDIANAMSEVMDGAPILNIMIKKLPQHSSKYLTKDQEYADRRNKINPQAVMQNRKNRLALYQRKLAEIEQDEDLFDRNPDGWQQTVTRLEGFIEKLEKLIKKGWQIKNAGRGQPDHTKGFSDFQSIDPTQKHELEGKIVIFVDDNLDSSHTMADAYKALMRSGVTPKQVIGFCPQKYE